MVRGPHPVVRGRSCAQIFNTVTDLAAFAFRKEAPAAFLQHYLDDFSLLSGSSEGAQAEFQGILDCAKAMGIPLSAGKLQLPSPTITFLCFVIDAPSLTIAVSDSKRLRHAKDARSLIGKNHTSQENLLLIAGKLMHVAEFLPLYKASLSYRICLTRRIL